MLLEDTMKKLKSLGQVAYEATPEGGQQNFGPWEKAPDLVKRIHEQMAKAVEKTVKRRMQRDGWLRFPKEEAHY
jgi:hypothetical protein